MFAGVRGELRTRNRTIKQCLGIFHRGLEMGTILFDVINFINWIMKKILFHFYHYIIITSIRD